MVPLCRPLPNSTNRTFNPIDDKEKLLQKLEEISVELEEDMARNGWTGRTITLKYKLDTYQGMSRIRVHYSELTCI